MANKSEPVSLLAIKTALKAFELVEGSLNNLRLESLQPKGDKKWEIGLSRTDHAGYLDQERFYYLIEVDLEGSLGEAPPVMCVKLIKKGEL